MLGDEGAGLFRRVAFAAGCVGEAFVEVYVDSFFVAEKPIILNCLGLDEIKGVREQFGRFAEGSAVELEFDSLFDGGV